MRRIYVIAAAVICAPLALYLIVLALAAMGMPVPDWMLP